MQTPWGPVAGGMGGGIGPGVPARPTPGPMGLSHALPPWGLYYLFLLYFMCVLNSLLCNKK